MKTKLLNEAGDLRTFAIVFDIGDEVTDGLTRFAREQRITGASLTAIGALSDVTLGYFDWNDKRYHRTPLREQVEVVSLVGNIALGDDAPKLHAHIVVGRRDGTAYGGHLLDGHVRPTLEVVLVETPAHLRRRMDDQTGLALIDLESR
jgi:predicted DNA-binding protein with PD1-like motif